VWSKDDKQQLAGTGGRVNGHARNRENRRQHANNTARINLPMWLQSDPCFQVPCRLLLVSKQSHHQQYFCELCSVVLKSVESEKYLGVTLSSDLSWSSHITAICTKANQKLGFIKRSVKGTPHELKCLAYVAFVRSGMEYASIIWDPHFIKDSDVLERV